MLNKLLPWLTLISFCVTILGHSEKFTVLVFTLCFAAWVFNENYAKTVLSNDQYDWLKEDMKKLEKQLEDYNQNILELRRR